MNETNSGVEFSCKLPSKSPTPDEYEYLAYREFVLVSLKVSTDSSSQLTPPNVMCKNHMR